MDVPTVEFLVTHTEIPPTNFESQSNFHDSC